MSVLPEKATHKRTRTFNQQLVLRAIYDRTAVSRAEIARLTGLTRTSVSALVADLLRDGLVEEVGPGPSTGGKAPILLRIRPDGRHSIGIDLTEEYFTGALVDLRGQIIQSIRLPLTSRDTSAAVRILANLIDGLSSNNGSGPLLGIGIGSPGVVDSRTGTIRWGVNLGWEDVPLGPMLKERYDLPVIVINDSQAAAVGEFTFNRTAAPRNLVVVRVGRGIGSGIILDGRLYQGDGSGAGEIGHGIFDGPAAGAEPEPCRCGRAGCLETTASMHAMVAAAQRVDPTIDSAAALVAALRAGHAAARSVVVAGGRRLGQGVAALMSVLNINLVLLIGPATSLGEEWLEAVREQAAMCTLPQLSRDARIELGAARDEDDVLVGASALVMTHELGLSLVR
jgi:predicted NBD/HSP70 family sugar kinase